MSQQQRQLVVGLTLGAVALYYAARLALADCDLQVASAPQSAVGPCFYGKRVWVTGASSGIGKELCRLIAKHGGQLLLSSRTESALLQCKQELLRDFPGTRVHLLPLDLADLASLRVKVWEAREIMGGDVDILINNGGVSQRAFALNTSFEADEHIFNVDFVSATILTKTLFESWTTRVDKSEHNAKGVINISSLAGKLGSPLRTAYCASKFALIGFMDSLRTEYGYDSGNYITITNICPGSVATAVSQNALSGGKALERFGGLDENIAQGMGVERCAELILRAYACKLEECWMFGQRREQIAAYLSQYAPTVMQYVLRRTAAQQRKYAESILASRNNNSN